MKLNSFIKLADLNRERIFIFLDFIFPYISCPDNNDKIVEVGCGTGTLANEIRIIHPNIHLIDRQDQREYCKDLKFHLLDVSRETLPFANYSVSMIIATQVIEHLENLTCFLNECHRVLKKDGLLAITYPNYSNLLQRLLFLSIGKFRRLNETVSSGGHINCLPIRNLLHFMSNKFSVDKISGDITDTELAFVCNIFFKLIGRKTLEKNIILPKIKSTLFTHNVMVVFSKKC